MKNSRIIFGLFLLALGIRLVVFLSIAIPLDNPLLLGGGDAGGYHRLALSLLERGTYTEPLFIARPPAFPTLMAILYWVLDTTNPLVVMGLNLLLSSAAASLTFFLALKLQMKWRVALISGILMALDPISIFYGVTALTEPMVTLFLLLGWIAMALVYEKQDKFRSKKTNFAYYGSWFPYLIGLFFGFSMLIKPVTILYWIIPAILILVWSNWRWALIVTVISLMFFFGWTSHNASVFNVPTFSSAGTWNMLFIRAVGVLRRVNMEDPGTISINLMREIERRAGNEVLTNDLTSDKIWDYFESNDPERLRIMREMALEIYTEHPIWYLMMVPVGLFRMYFNTPFEYSWLIVLSAFFHLLVYSAALGGITRLWRVKGIFALVIGTVLYFSVVSVAAQTAAMDARFRLPYFPLVCLAAAFFLAKHKEQKNAPDSRYRHLSP